MSDRLYNMPAEVSGANLRDTAQKGAEVIRAEASKKAPVQTGNLRDNIVTEIVREQEGVSVRVAIGPSEEAWYGKLVEQGHAKVSGGQRREYRAAKREGGKDFEWSGGYVAPRPFLRPAFDEKKAEAEQVMADDLRRKLEK